MLKKLNAWQADTQRTATPQPGGWDQLTKTGEEWHALFRQFMQERRDSYSKRSSAAEKKREQVKSGTTIRGARGMKGCC